MEEYVLTPLSDLENMANTVRAVTGSTDTFSISELSNVVSNTIQNGGSGSSSGIIDVLELPKTDINENSFYRLLTGSFVCNQNILDWICYCVSSLPDVGEPVSMDMINVTAYYNISDNLVYGYINSALSTMAGIPVGWYTMDILGQAFNVDYGGIITNMSDDPQDGAVRLLLNYEFYLHKDNTWFHLPYAYETMPTFDIRWNGDPTGRAMLDLSIMGMSGYFVHISDMVPTVEELVGAVKVSNQGNYIPIEESDIDTSTYPGGIDVGGYVVVVNDADTLNAVLGTSGYPNGVWFYYNPEETHWCTRLVAASTMKTVKFDEKFLPEYTTFDDVNYLISQAIGIAIGGSY